jgi:hypothetical protein
MEENKMASTVASYRTRQSPLTLAAHNLRPAVKFDAAFIERRMREHKAWQEEQAAESAAEIVDEVVVALCHTMKARAQRDNQKRLK